MNYRFIYILFFLIVISKLTYSQDFVELEDSLIEKTIDKYSRHRLLMIQSYYTIARIDNYETEDYWVVSYLPDKHNKFTPQRSKIDSNKLDLVYNKVRIIKNHPIFWSTKSDSSSYDFVVETMNKYNLIDSFFIDFDENKIYDYDSYPTFVIDDGAMVVYYVIRREDFKIIKKMRTGKWGKIYEYMDKLRKT
jgi:hypothetical protein